MQTINLYIMDMSHADNTSGVDRYIGTLLRGLEMYPHVNVYWIHLRYDKTLLFHQEERNEFYTKTTIPLPYQFNEIIAERFWIRRYNEQVYRIVQHLFEAKSNAILHIHTLNLIDLAMYIKGKITCKIITHLHCIPWKGYYNTNRRVFNHLYQQSYLSKVETIPANNFLTNNCEQQSYTEADHIICVTRCAVDFLSNTMKIPAQRTTVVPNGINDFVTLSDSNKKRKKENSRFKLLYVGVLSESKGLKYILEAMRKVQQKGYKLSLSIAGKTTSNNINQFTNDNPDLELDFLGRITFDELKRHYMDSDIGIIASLQEQSSYVAIEMSMFGLPIITTAVDGLDEIFTDEINALKVNTRFSPTRGLSVDVEMMANQIIRMINDKDLRNRLSKNTRTLYENELNLRRMIQQTISVYQTIVEN